MTDDRIFDVARVARPGRRRRVVGARMSAEIIRFIPRPKHDREQTDFPTIVFCSAVPDDLSMGHADDTAPLNTSSRIGMRSDKNHHRNSLPGAQPHQNGSQRAGCEGESLTMFVLCSKHHCGIPLNSSNMSENSRYSMFPSWEFLS